MCTPTYVRTRLQLKKKINSKLNGLKKYIYKNRIYIDKSGLIHIQI